MYKGRNFNRESVYVCGDYIDGDIYPVFQPAGKRIGQSGNRSSQFTGVHKGSPLHYPMPLCVNGTALRLLFMQKQFLFFF